MQRIVLKPVLVFLILAVVQGGYANVLCYGHDSHGELEPLFHTSCSDHVHGQKTDLPPHSHDLKFMDTCSPCVDVLIGNEIEPVRFQKSGPCEDLPWTAVPAGGTSLLRWRIWNDPNISSGFFAPLSSIILLI